MKRFQPKILIVEDEPDIAGTLQSYLGRRGFQVSSTASGLEALSLIEISKPDVVILDFSLNDLNGQDVLKRLRCEDKRTQVVVITGQMLPPDEINRIHQLGIAEYFNKPIVLKELGAVIGRLTGHDLTVKKQFKWTPGSDLIYTEQPSRNKDFHKLVNLLGIMRNKSENFTWSREEGIYRDKSTQELLDMSDSILREIITHVDEALGVVNCLREEQ